MEGELNLRKVYFGESLIKVANPDYPWICSFASLLNNFYFCRFVRKRSLNLPRARPLSVPVPLPEESAPKQSRRGRGVMSLLPLICAALLFLSGRHLDGCATKPPHNFNLRRRAKTLTLRIADPPLNNSWPPHWWGVGGTGRARIQSPMASDNQLFLCNRPPLNP